MNNFKTKSRAIELLGRKQIRDGTTALAEILKNSYDADAENSQIIFETANNKNCLFIVDDGIGMTAEDLLNKWLVIGTNSKKKKNRHSVIKNRLIMGEKGIGRLATACLGQQLLLLSKNYKEKTWNILFIDWNIFENPYTYIEDIDVGLILNRSVKSIQPIESVINELNRTLITNLEDNSWLNNDEIYELKTKILTQLHNYLSTIDIVKLKNKINAIEKTGHGTILLISHLWDDWDLILDTMRDKNDKKTDSYASNAFDRLQTFLYSLNNTAKDFKLKFWFNNTPLAIEYGFTEEDYNIYDVKIEGKVQNGIFIGKIDALNSNKELLNECNKILSTSGIDLKKSMLLDYTKKYDCGSYTIKLCHVEGAEKNSSLSASNWRTMTDKLNRLGGVRVYRDGVRILPYGETENDFLGIEKRRTLQAGHYVFSHRRLFGRIDITYKDNPGLEDKSSREGFIENRFYYYFTTTLKQLLIEIATNFLNGRGIRDSFIMINNLKHQKIKEEEETIIRQKKELSQEVKRLKALLKNKKNVMKTYHKDENTIQNRLKDIKNGLVNVRIYSSILEFKNQALKLFNSWGKIIDILLNEEITIQNRFSNSIDEELALEVLKFNKLVKQEVQQGGKRKEEFEKLLNKSINNSLNVWNKQVNQLTGTDIEAIKQALFESLKESVSLCEETADGLKNLLYNNLSPYVSAKKYIDNEFNILNSINSSHNKDISQQKEFIIKKLGILHTEVKQLESIDIDTLKPRILNLTENLEYVNGVIDKFYKEQKSKISNSLSNVPTRLIIIKEFCEKDFSVNELIDALTKKNALLEQENDMLLNLSNIGLAAEVVDHEFNQYFTNVGTSLKILKNANLSNGLRYHINQIEVGFRAVSNRHSQLSPMYRSYNLRKKNIRVMDLIKDIVNFYTNKIRKANISMGVNIPEDSILRLSPSKIYPVLSNILDNAIYWVRGNEEKIILWRYIDETGELYIEDNGPGVDIKLSEQIFEPFISLKPNGRGLGLSIARKVLELEGYKLDLITDRGKKVLDGACFRITFTKEK